MSNTIHRPEVETALRERRFGQLKAAFQDAEPAEAAAVIEDLAEDERAVAFRLLGPDKATVVFEYLSPDAQESLIHGLGHERVAEILNEMSADDRTALLDELPPEVTRQVMAMLSPEERRIAATLLGYPEDSIGRLMTPDYVRVKESWSVTRALAHIRKYGEDKETLNVIYVIDDHGKLLDDLRIRYLLLANPDARVSDVTDGSFVALSAWDDQEKVVGMFQEYDRVALPVVDSSGVLLGIVTFDDVMDVAEEEATEDIQMLGGMAALDNPYIETGFVQMLRKRAGWLTLLFVGQMLTANAIQFFEGKVSQAWVLVAFMPLIIASGGNSGSQAAALVIRSLALGEVGLRDWWRVMRREILSGLALGAIVAAVAFARIALEQQFLVRAGLENYGPHWALLAVALSGSLILVVLWGTIVGSMLPFLLQRLGADPAVSSTPFVSTLVDVTGIVIYFSICIAVLSGTYL